jgi:Holliday junction DNA helicase RuvA
MIAHLRGTLLTKHPNQVVVETAGVGYEVNISVPTFSELPANGSQVALHIHTHVREDLLALYGFLRPAEKANEMAAAIRGNDVARLTRIPGIGKKTAERMVLELRDKLPEAVGTSTPAAPAISALEEDVLSALVNLGYQRIAAEKALAAVVKNGKSGSFDAMFREALVGLSK